MILSKVRSYINANIAEIDSDMVEWDSPFNSDNIPETLADRAYFIKYDVTSTAENNAWIDDSITAEVKFFFKAFNSEIEAYDEAMDKVNSIRINCISLESIEAYKSLDDNPINKVFSLSQTGENLQGNERQIIITMRLEIGLTQGVC